MRIKGSSQELESRRRAAVRLVGQGMSLRQVAEVIGCSPSSVQRWKDAVAAGGEEALKAKPAPGAKPKLSDRQKQQLVKLLKRGPRKAGYATDLWTCPRVAKVIEQRFGVRYHVNYVPNILRSLGWSPQKPEQRARERDEQAIVAWRSREWPRIKKEARKAS